MTHAAAQSFVADGELRAWLDGNLVYEQTGMVFRTTPDKPAYSPELLRPARELGIRNICALRGKKMRRESPLTLTRTHTRSAQLFSRRQDGLLD